MESWRTKPTVIDNAPSETKLALFIDESGNSMYKGTTEHNRYFTLCACLFTLPELKTAQEKMLTLKSKYWNNGEFAYKEGYQRVTFHMSEIAQALKGFSNKNNPFSYIKENVHPFYLEYKQLIRELDFFVFSVTVDKLAMKERYCHPYDPYAYALELLLERVHHCVDRLCPESSDSVVILVESSGKRRMRSISNVLQKLWIKVQHIKANDAFHGLKGLFSVPREILVVKATMDWRLLISAHIRLRCILSKTKKEAKNLK